MVKEKGYTINLNINDPVPLSGRIDFDPSKTIIIFKDKNGQYHTFPKLPIIPIEVKATKVKAKKKVSIIITAKVNSKEQ